MTASFLDLMCHCTTVLCSLPVHAESDFVLGWICYEMDEKFQGQVNRRPGDGLERVRFLCIYIHHLLPRVSHCKVYALLLAIHGVLWTRLSS